MNDVREEEEQSDVSLDPRIQRELEALNEAASSINELERELENAQSKLRHEKKSAVERLGHIYQSSVRKSVDISKPYYELLSLAKQAHNEIKLSTSRYQAANQSCETAKKNLSDIELRLVAGSTRGGATQIDSKLLDELNCASEQLMIAKRHCMDCEREHEYSMRQYNDIQQRLGSMHSQHTRSINKAKTFYDIKEALEFKLQIEQQNVTDLQMAVSCAKQKYHAALDALENISESIHAARGTRLLQLPARTPGVGAEAVCSVEELTDMCTINLDQLADGAASHSYDSCSDEGSVKERVLSVSSLSQSELGDSCVPVGSPGADCVSSQRSSGAGEIPDQRLSGAVHIADQKSSDAGRVSSQNSSGADAISGQSSSGAGMRWNRRSPSTVTIGGSAGPATGSVGTLFERSVEGAEDRERDRAGEMLDVIVRQASVCRETDVVRDGVVEKGVGGEHLNNKNITLSGLKSGVYMTREERVNTNSHTPPAFNNQSGTRSNSQSIHVQQQQQNQLPLLLGLRSAITQPLSNVKK